MRYRKSFFRVLLLLKLQNFVDISSAKPTFCTVVGTDSGLLLRFCIQRYFSPTHYPKYSSYNYTILITITYEFNKRQKYFVISCSCLYIHVYIWVLYNVRNTIRINPNTNHSSIFMIIYAYHCITVWIRCIYEIIYILFLIYVTP